MITALNSSENSFFEYRKSLGYCIELEKIGDQYIERDHLPELKPEKIIDIGCIEVKCADLSAPYLYILNTFGILRVYNWPDYTLHNSFHETVTASSMKIIPERKIAIGYDYQNKIEVYDFLASKKLDRGQLMQRSLFKTLIAIGKILVPIFRSIVVKGTQVLSTIDQYASARLPQNVKITTYRAIAALATGITAWYTLPFIVHSIAIPVITSYPACLFLTYKLWKYGENMFAGYGQGIHRNIRLFTKIATYAALIMAATYAHNRLFDMP